MIGKTAAADKVAKWKAIDDAKKAKIHAIDTGKRAAAKQKVRYAVRTDGKRKVRDGVGAIIKRTGLDKTKPVKAANALITQFNARLNPVRNKVVNSIWAKTVRTPFKFFSGVNIFVKKLLVYFGGAMLGALLLYGGFLTICQAFFPPSADGDTNGAIDAPTNAQTMVDYLYEYHQAYMINIFEAGRVSHPGGKDYLDYGIPKNWELHEEHYPNDEAISDTSMTAVKKDGKIVGYNLYHYWGPSVIDYHATVIVDYDSLGNPITDVMTVHKGIGNLGTFGVTDIGEYEDLDAIILKDSDAYEENRHHDNDELTVKFKFHGSEFSYKYTDEEPHTGESYTVRDSDDLPEPMFYSMDELYRGFVSCAVAFCGNEPENTNFWNRYGKQVFDVVMENATLTLTNVYTEDDDSDHKVEWWYTGGPGGRQHCEDRTLISHIMLVVDIDDSGIQDMMRLSEWSGKELGDLEDHSVVYLQEHFPDISGLGNGDKVIRDWPQVDPDIDGVDDDFAHKGAMKEFNILNNWFTPKGSVTKYILRRYGHSNGFVTDPRYYPDGWQYYQYWWGWYADGDPDYPDVYPGLKADGLSENTHKDDSEIISEVMEGALDYYEFRDGDWEETFPGLTFPAVLPNIYGKSYPSPFFSDEELAEIEDEEALIKTILDLITDLHIDLDGDRGDLINFALSCVGKFVYKYGGSVTDFNHLPSGLDCSGFISFVLSMGDPNNYKRYTAGELAHSAASTTWDGNYDSLQPGTLIVKNGTYGTSTGSSNHVMLYIGKVQMEGDSEPRDYCVECTTSTNSAGQKVSGVQLTSEKRMKYVAQNYQFVVDPFSL